MDVPGTPPGRVVSYGAIGLGWQLLRDRFSTWLLATVVMWLVLGGLGIVLQLLTVGLVFGEYYLLGPHPIPLAPFLSVVLNVGIQGLLIGGQFRMALKQIDGGEIAVGDMFSLGGSGNAGRDQGDARDVPADGRRLRLPDPAGPDRRRACRCSLSP